MARICTPINCPCRVASQKKPCRNALSTGLRSNSGQFLLCMWPEEVPSCSACWVGSPGLKNLDQARPTSWRGVPRALRLTKTRSLESHLPGVEPFPRRRRSWLEARQAHGKWGALRIFNCSATRRFLQPIESPWQVSRSLALVKTPDRRRLRSLGAGENRRAPLANRFSWPPRSPLRGCRRSGVSCPAAERG